MDLQMYKFFFKQKKKNLFFAFLILINNRLHKQKIPREEIFINNSKKMCTFANSILTKKETKNIAER